MLNWAQLWWIDFWAVEAWVNVLSFNLCMAATLKMAADQREEQVTIRWHWKEVGL